MGLSNLEGPSLIDLHRRCNRDHAFFCKHTKVPLIMLVVWLQDILITVDDTGETEHNLV